MRILHNVPGDITTTQAEELIVELFDGGDVTKTVTIQAWHKLLYLIIATNSRITIEVQALGEGSEWVVQSVVASRHGQAVTGSLTGVLSASNTTLTMEMLSLLGEDGIVELNGWVRIDPNITKASGHLHQDNLLIGDNVRLTTLPQLDVRSDDVSASHGSRIHSIDPVDTFYMRTRGLTEYEAQCLIIDGYINTAFARFGAPNHAELLSLKSHVLRHLALPILGSDD